MTKSNCVSAPKVCFPISSFFWANKAKIAPQWVYHWQFKLPSLSAWNDFCNDVNLKRETDTDNREVPWDSKWSLPPNRAQDGSKGLHWDLTADLTGLSWSSRTSKPAPQNARCHVELLFDPDLTAATGIILFISYFIDIWTNFSFFFYPFCLLFHQPSFTIFFLPQGPPAHATSTSSHSSRLSLCCYTVSVCPGFSCTADSHWYTTPSSYPLPLSVCVSIRFVWRRIWPRPRPSCLSCS